MASGTVLAMLALSPAHAQQAPAPEAPATTPDLGAEDDPCEIAPGGDAQAALPGGVERPGADQLDESLSATLDRCGGVLAPPDVGDPGMVEPAPDEGTTPVIPPSAVPDQE
ncbi:hypothetical protein EJC49_05210 [Aquibium carbonis]|uniref:Uncharacterized protein n=2 Tax=Aquibium carbonis TaxID=2495581 RepID=A0A3S0GAL4_9HYPH|nr:hypothetical protein EJC49_05210 [Aquibium carbonis]